MEGWGDQGEMREMLFMFGAGSLRVHLTMRRPRAATSALLLMCESVSVSMRVVCACVCTHASSCNYLEYICTCTVSLYLHINMCMGLCAYVCLNWGSISEQEHLREDKACEVDAQHGRVCALRVCVRGPLLRLWSTKSPVLLCWIKPMIHGLKPHSRPPAFIHSQTDKEAVHARVSVSVWVFGGLNMSLSVQMSIYMHVHLCICSGTQLCLSACVCDFWPPIPWIQVCIKAANWEIDRQRERESFRARVNCHHHEETCLSSAGSPGLLDSNPPLARSNKQHLIHVTLSPHLPLHLPPHRPTGTELILFCKK